MSLIISVYPVEVTVLPVTGAGDLDRGSLWCRGWTGAPRSCTGVPGTRGPAGRSCPWQPRLSRGDLALQVPAAFCCQRVNDRNRSEIPRQRTSSSSRRFACLEMGRGGAATNLSVLRCPRSCRTHCPGVAICCGPPGMTSPGVPSQPGPAAWDRTLTQRVPMLV